MEDNLDPRYPRAAGGLLLMLVGTLLNTAGGLSYRLGALLPAGLVAAAGGTLYVAGLYRAGADEPGFYRALIYQAVSFTVNQGRGYLGYGFYYISILFSVAAMVLTLRALNLACAAAVRLLSASGRDSLAFLGGIVRKTNIICYAAALAETFLTPLLGGGFLLAAQLICIPLSLLCLVFLFLAARAMRAGHQDHPTTT